MQTPLQTWVHKLAAHFLLRPPSSNSPPFASKSRWQRRLMSPMESLMNCLDKDFAALESRAMYSARVSLWLYPTAGQVQLPTPTQRCARSNAPQLFKKTKELCQQLLRVTVAQPYMPKSSMTCDRADSARDSNKNTQCYAALQFITQSNDAQQNGRQLRGQATQTRVSVQDVQFEHRFLY